MSPVTSLHTKYFECVNNGMNIYKTVLSNKTRFGDVTG